MSFDEMVILNRLTYQGFENVEEISDGFDEMPPSRNASELELDCFYFLMNKEHMRSNLCSLFFK